MSVIGKCNLPELFDPLKKPDKQYTADELSDLEIRWRRLVGQVQNLSFSAEPAETAKIQRQLEVAGQQSEWMLKAGEAGILKPRNSDKLRDFLARNFAIEYDDFMQRHMNDVGEVRKKLRDFRHFVDFQVADKMARIETIRQIADAQSAAYKITRKLPKEAQDRLWVGAQEEGQFPRLMEASGTAPMAARRMNQKYQDFVDEALAAGLQDHEVKDLIVHAATVGAAYDEGLAIAKGSGIPMGEVDTIGYFRRKFTPDVSAIIAKRKAIEDGGITSPKSLYQSFQKSRTTFDFVVEDEHLLAYALGKPFNEVTGLIEDSKKLLEELHKIPNSHVDQLVKMGVVGKIPLTSTELVKDLAARYELPFKQLGDVFITDQVKGYLEYTNNLKSVVSKSTILQGIMKEGLNNGWAVTAAQHAVDPEFKNFSKIDGTILNKYLNEGRRTALDATGGVYVHPVVKNMAHALLDLSTSPEKIGQVAEVVKHIQFFMKNSKLLMLAVPRYAFVNTVGGVVQSFTAGGNLLTALPNYIQYIKLQHQGEGILENTKKVFAGGTLTEQELFRKLRETGAINDFIPGIAIQGTTPNLNAWNPGHAAKAATYAYYTLKQFGVHEGIKKTEDLISNLISEPVMALGGLANTSDNAFKWNTYKTVLADDPLIHAGGFLTTGTVNRFGSDIDAARLHVDRYFFDYTNQGEWDKGISKYVFPFWMYMSRNMPGQWRHMISNPHQYLAYHRLHAVINDQAEQDPNLDRGMVSKFTNEAFPLFFKGQGGDYFAMHTTAYDPIADGFVGAKNLLNDVQYAVTGKYSGSDEQMRRQAAGTYHSDFIDKYVQSSYPLYKSAVQGLEFLTGAERDSLTNKPLVDDPSKPVSFLGKEMHPLARLFLEQNFPILGTANAVNPGNVFGSPMKVDGQGNITQMPTPSFLGDARSDKDSKSPLLRAAAPFIGSVGTQLDASTRALNMGYTESDLKALDRHLNDRVKKILSTYPVLTPTKQAEAKQEMENAKNIMFTVRLDLARISAWRKENNVLPNKVAESLALKNLTVKDLPVKGQTPEEVRRIERLTERFNTFDLMVQEEKRRNK